VRAVSGSKLSDSLFIIEAVSKIGSWFKVKADVTIKPEEYNEYFED